MTFQDELDAPDRQWRTLNAPITNAIGERSPEKYLEVVKQFNVETSNRYRPRPPMTFCNIFVSDVTRAMLADIPHWIKYIDSLSSERDHDARELTANATLDILNHGAWGYFECAMHEARDYANAGRPTVAAWFNPVGPGHIAMLVPSEHESVTVAQAGLVCSSSVAIATAFGVKRMDSVRYFWHA